MLTRLPGLLPQVSNATAVYVRRPGAARKFKAEVVCDGKVRKGFVSFDARGIFAVAGS